MLKWFCLKKPSRKATSQSSNIPSSIVSDLEKLNLTEERLKRYADETNIPTSDTTFTIDMAKDSLRDKAISLREKSVSEALNNIKRSMEVDFCFVLDCTELMTYHIVAAKDCILQVSNYIKTTNPGIGFRVGFCGYRDHDYGPHHIQIFNFTNSYEDFRNYLADDVSAIYSSSNRDIAEDVLGGLNAAITQMNWKNSTRVLFHICDYPPHGRRFTDLQDNYPDGDPNGLTAESVLEKMQSENILYFFGKVTGHTERMLEVFRSIIGEFPVFDLVGGDPIELINKFFKAASSSITMAVSITSTLGTSSKDIYSLKKKKLEMNPNEPDWNLLSLQEGVVLWYRFPRTMDELKNPNFFEKSNLFSTSYTFKIASNPFSAGVERYAYFALNTKCNPAKKMVIKEYLNVGRRNPFEKYLEAVEVSTVAFILSAKFNSIAKRKTFKLMNLFGGFGGRDIIQKVNFLDVFLLRTSTIEFGTQYYTIEPKLENAEFKRFNTNTGVITKFRPTLEAFAHFTYEYTGGYLVVYDLQGIEIGDQFLLTDPAIHCTDSLRFGRTNFGKRGIEQCFLANHKCNDICKKLELSHISTKYF